jgi:hypothetical protein
VLAASLRAVKHEQRCHGAHSLERRNSAVERIWLFCCRMAALAFTPPHPLVDKRQCERGAFHYGMPRLAKLLACCRAGKAP